MKHDPDAIRYTNLPPCLDREPIRLPAPAPLSDSLDRFTDAEWRAYVSAVAAGRSYQIRTFGDLRRWANLPQRTT